MNERRKNFSSFRKSLTLASHCTVYTCWSTGGHPSACSPKMQQAILIFLTFVFSSYFFAFEFGLLSHTRITVIMYSQLQRLFFVNLLLSGTKFWGIIRLNERLWSVHRFGRKRLSLWNIRVCNGFDRLLFSNQQYQTFKFWIALLFRIFLTILHHLENSLLYKIFTSRAAPNWKKKKLSRLFPPRI